MTFEEPLTERSGLESPAKLSARLNLPFDDLRLLTRALTHSSYVNEHGNAGDDNERLEFLGDAVLDFLVGAYVYQHFVEMREGEMTRMRSALVRTEALAYLARELELGNALRLGRGELQSGGRSRETLLCGTFEALVGALYQHKGLEAARDFVLPLIKPLADRFSFEVPALTIDAKSRLQEWSQHEGLGIPKYIPTATEGPDHAKIFVAEVHIDGKLFGVGAGTSKKEASQAAAQNAIDNMDMNADLTGN
ncbi:MAG: ribonuclease III [Anaerolineales bacterium]|jgi:ribonuclease-3|nr:ribonuclease III [Anaerolineales bacterium]